MSPHRSAVGASGGRGESGLTFCLDIHHRLQFAKSGRTRKGARSDMSQLMMLIILMEMRRRSVPSKGD